MLFEDGHVEYFDTPINPHTGDDIFHNNNGEVAPGTDANDAVIVPPQVKTK